MACAGDGLSDRRAGLEDERILVVEDEVLVSQGQTVAEAIRAIGVTEVIRAAEQTLGEDEVRAGEALVHK